MIAAPVSPETREVAKAVLAAALTTAAVETAKAVVDELRKPETRQAIVDAVRRVTRGML